MTETIDRAPFVSDAGHRGRLVRLAYRLLGSVEDAEDVVQDALLKLMAVSRPPDDPDAWLFRTVTNLAIDRLRRRKVQRRAYPGPWLPEPLVTEHHDTEALAERRDDLGIGLLLLLEELSVSERVAFVLREAFDLDFRAMAEVLEVRADACRQRYHRARRKLAGARWTATPSKQQRQLLERLIEAVMAGDRAGLTELLADDAVLVTDGGGRVSAAIRPVHDPNRIAQVMLHLAARQNVAAMTLERRRLNGGAGLLIRAGNTPFACIQVAGAGQAHRISRLYVMRNPDKLRRL